MSLYFLLFSVVIIIPLIFSTKTADPNLGPRLLALGIVVLGISLMSLFKPLKDKPQFSYNRFAIFPVIIIYLIWSVISLSQAINPAEGLFNITKTTLTIALLIYAVQIFNWYSNSFVLLTKSVIVSSVVATSIGFYQYFENVPGNTGMELFKALYEVKGLMAHKNQFVISMFLMLPFTLYGISRFKKVWLALSLLQTLLILVSIVILQTRGVWVATIVSAIIYAIMWLISNKRSKTDNKAGLLKRGMKVIMIVAIIVSLSAVVFEKSGAIDLLKYKVSSIFDSKSHDNQGRLKMWESTWHLSQDNFIFGVGAGNWKIAVLPYYNANFGSNYQNWRRPHNDFLWVLSEKGIIGLVFYLLIFLIITVYAFKIIFNEEDKDKIVLISLLISGLGGYLVVSFFTFPLERINHQIYIALFMAVIVSMYSTMQDKRPSAAVFNMKLNAIVVIIASTAIFYSIVLIRSEVYTFKLMSARSSGKWEKVKLYAEKAFTPITTVDATSMPIYLHRGVANVKLNKRNEAVEDFKIALEYFPTQIATLNNLAIVSAEMNNYPDAILYFNKALEIYPNYKTSLWNLVKVYYKEREYKKAYIALLNYSPDNTPDDYDRLKADLEYRLNVVNVP